MSRLHREFVAALALTDKRCNRANATATEVLITTTGVLYSPMRALRHVKHLSSLTIREEPPYKWLHPHPV